MNHVLKLRPIVAVAIIALLVTATTSAHHSWRKYHWARVANPFTLDVGDNVNSAWDPYLTEAISDWNGSIVLDLNRVGGGTNGSTCAPTSGRIEACNAAYGKNGWLGIAQIWIASGSHIRQAITKLNDSYFNAAPYNTPAWRRLVTCQEIAHDFGLDHQDERFTNRNLGTCMDYTNDPDGSATGGLSNEHPNAHDFEQLITIYGSHNDSTSTVAGGLVNPRAARPEAAEWGRLVRTNANNRVQVYEKDLGNGNLIITHVFWADPEADGRGNK